MPGPGLFSIPLRRMRRGMTRDRFRALLLRAARANPRIHLATDVIAGFPGETDAEFAETEELLEGLPLASLHVFPFSPRSGTAAALLAGSASDHVPQRCASSDVGAPRPRRRSCHAAPQEGGTAAPASGETHAELTAGLRCGRAGGAGCREARHER